MAYGLTKSAHIVQASSQYLSVAGGATLAITNNITIEGWYYFADTNQQMLAGKWGDASLANCSYYFQYDGGGLLNFHWTDGSSEADTSVSWSPSTSTWYHIAVTMATGSVKYYLNGTQLGTTQSGSPTTMNSASGIDTNIGTYKSSSGSRMNANVSLVRIWSVVRTQGEISGALCSVLGSTTSLKAEWTLDNTLNDNSGNSLTLTDHGTVTFQTNLPATCATVGPANVKTWDGVTQSTGIKTYEGLALASTKTVIGVS